MSHRSSRKSPKRKPREPWWRGIHIGFYQFPKRERAWDKPRFMESWFTVPYPVPKPRTAWDRRIDVLLWVFVIVGGGLLAYSFHNSVKSAKAAKAAKAAVSSPTGTESSRPTE